MRVHSKAIRTSLIIQERIGFVEDKGDFLVLRTPLVPDYWYGNCLVMPRPPEPGDVSSWLGLFESEFPDAKHRVFIVDGTDGLAGDEAGFLEAGLECNTLEVLSTRLHARPERLNTDYVYRPFSSDADWRSGVETSVAVNKDTPGYTRGYIERSFAVTRAAVEQGHGSWWGAWDGQQNVGQMGLFHDAGMARFKDVETHPFYRGRGICRSLLFALCEAAALDYGSPEFVIVPEDDDVRRIYESLGFRLSEKSVDYCKSPPLAI